MTHTEMTPPPAAGPQHDSTVPSVATWESEPPVEAIRALCADMESTARYLLDLSGRFGRGEKSPGGTLNGLHLLTEEVDDLVDRLARLRRADGATWGQIGADLHMTKQAAAKRYGS